MVRIRIWSLFGPCVECGERMGGGDIGQKKKPWEVAHMALYEIRANISGKAKGHGP